MNTVQGDTVHFNEIGECIPAFILEPFDGNKVLFNLAAIVPSVDAPGCPSLKRFIGVGEGDVSCTWHRPEDCTHREAEKA